MRIFLTVIFITLAVLSVKAENTIKEKEIKKVNELLNKQVDAWKKGNLSKFMET